MGDGRFRKCNLGLRPQKWGVDPSLQQRLLFVGQGSRIGWHAQDGIATGNAFNEITAMTIPRDDDWFAGIAASQRFCHRIQTKLGFLCVRSVTLDAPRLQDGQDTIRPVNRLCSDACLQSENHQEHCQMSMG